MEDSDCPVTHHYTSPLLQNALPVTPGPVSSATPGPPALALLREVLCLRWFRWQGFGMQNGHINRLECILLRIFGALIGPREPETLQKYSHP